MSSAKILDVLGAFLLKLRAAGVGGDALRVQFLADKGRNGLSVVLQAGHRVVGGARAFPRQVGQGARVLARVVVAKSFAGVGLGLAPLGSLGGCHGAGVNGHVERAGVVRDLGRNRRSRDGEQSK